MIKTITSKLNLKRPKIVEQIMMVLIVAVIVPFVIIGIIILNISQQSVRKELNYSTKIMAQYIGEDISIYNKVLGIKDYKQINKVINQKFSKEKREIYIIDEYGKIVATNIEDTPNPKEVLADLPIIKLKGSSESFGSIKNRPKAYYIIKDINWTVIVSTPAQITKNTINLARFRILLALFGAACFIFFIVGLYTFYLYLNMRQLLKGVIAISKGNYERKIHLIKNIFAPYEIYFITKEFNYMARKISTSYKELSEKNTELQRLDKFRANLVSSTSHEFRTPLTNIIGYSSRLLRQDIVLDEATKNKSLKIIKEQAQMLSRMVEDLLVIPEIESYSLKFMKAETNLSECIEKTTIYCNSKGRTFNLSLEENLPFVMTDEDRLMQILVNLVDNAIKYSEIENAIDISAKYTEESIKVSISNKFEKINDETLNKLCDKFIRMDSNITKTTRGTGLGLFIVKGLSEALNIEFYLESKDNKFIANLIFRDVVK